MSGPSERIGRAPSSTTSSTISTARSTPKQKPNSSASRTSMLLSRLRGPLPGLLAPLLSQLVAAGDAIINPVHFPPKRIRKHAEQGLLNARHGVSDVFGHNCV